MNLLYTLLNVGLPFLVGGLFSLYFLFKKKLPVHTLVVLLTLIPYVARDTSRWPFIYEPAVQYLMIALYVSLLMRVIDMIRQENTE